MWRCCFEGSAGREVMDEVVAVALMLGATPCAQKGQIGDELWASRIDRCFSYLWQTLQTLYAKCVQIMQKVSYRVALINKAVSCRFLASLLPMSTVS